jgi:8-hydroxy-5-deazaflavin:NADPH oxidoreductase
MKIAIIGTGNVGSALANRWSKTSHSVVFGVRDIKKAVAGNPEIPTRLVNDAIADADAILLAVPFDAVESIVTKSNLAKKTLLDATNPLRADLSGLTIGPETSAAEKIAGWALGAHVVKVFNTTGANNMADPSYHGRPLTMLYAGDDPGAKEIAARLIRDAGMDPVDAGPLRNARLLEPFAMMWIYLAFHGAGRDFAFQLVKR